MNLIQKLKRLKHLRMLRKMSPYYSVDKSSFLTENFNLRLDNPKAEAKYVLIGQDSIIAGNFIFESSCGQVVIGNHCWIGNSTFICNSEIVIEDYVTIAWGSTFYTHNSHSLDYKERQKDMELSLLALRSGQSIYQTKDWSKVAKKPIRICSNAWIGMNCLILKGVTIGEGAIVGAGSVVTKDVPPWTVVGGNPAKVLKQLVV